MRKGRNTRCACGEVYICAKGKCKRCYQRAWYERRAAERIRAKREEGTETPTQAKKSRAGFLPCGCSVSTWLHKVLNLKNGMKLCAAHGILWRQNWVKAGTVSEMTTN